MDSFIKGTKAIFFQKEAPRGWEIVEKIDEYRILCRKLADDLRHSQQIPEGKGSHNHREVIKNG